jgi:hypothetical protein
VAESCADGGEGNRKVTTESERSFGKAKEEEAAAPVGDSGIKFSFVKKD